MALRSVNGGRGPGGAVVQSCSAPPVNWTIQVKDHNLGGDPNIQGADILVQVDGGAAQTVRTDDNGYINLVFDPGENVSAHTVQITHVANGWTGAASAPVGGGTQYQSNALLTGTWNLRVRVLANSTALGNSDLRITAGESLSTGSTGSSGGAYRLDGIPCEAQRVIAVTDARSAAALRRSATGKIGGGEAFPLAGALVRDGVSFSVDDQNQITVGTAKNNVTVVVEFQLTLGWTLQVLVKNQDAAGTPNMAAAPIRLAAGETVDESPRTGGDGSAYSKNNMVPGTAYTVSLQDALGASPRLSSATITVNGAPLDVSRGAATAGGVTASRTETNQVSLNAAAAGAQVVVTFLVRRVWTLKVLLKDRRPKGVAGDPIALRTAPFTIASNGTTTALTTGDDASAYQKQDMKVGAQYTISVPDGFGAIVANTEVAITAGDAAVNMRVNDPAVTSNNTQVTRPAANQVGLLVSQSGREVTVDFRLRYPTIFIAGEGEQWGYALGLARKYAKGDADAVRNRELQPDRDSDATALADTRKWVIASQYDITDAPTANVPSNLFVYRDATLGGGRFDVRDGDCWRRLKTAFDLFEAAVFNNPHPGYGLHKAIVFGLQNSGSRQYEQGNYICVHSLGLDTTLTSTQVKLFRDYRDGTGGVRRYNMTTAENQRYFLQTDVGCTRDGADRVPSFADDGSVSTSDINTSYIPIDDSQADAAGRRATRFQDRVTHYRSQVNTTGLWQSVLRCYRLNGLSAVQVGGAIFVNGSTNFAGECAGGKSLEGFADAGVWKDHATYYSNYVTNFTSTRFHPSFFHNTRSGAGWAASRFNPGEPNLSGAHAYRLARTA